MTVPRLFLVLIALVLPGIQAVAQSGAVGIRSPSGNIFCQAFTDGKVESLRCDIIEMATEPRRPRDCELDWGHAFGIASNSAVGSRICHGDTMMDQTLPVLGYGKVWQHKGFTCTSEQSGLTCFNASRHGFSLSRAEQKLF